MRYRVNFAPSPHARTHGCLPAVSPELGARFRSNSSSLSPSGRAVRHRRRLPLLREPLQAVQLLLRQPLKGAEGAAPERGEPGEIYNIVL